MPVCRTECNCFFCFNKVEFSHKKKKKLVFFLLFNLFLFAIIHKFFFVFFLKYFEKQIHVHKGEKMILTQRAHYNSIAL